jgi:oligo-alginate lyase
MRLLTAFLLFFQFSSYAQHPVAFATKADFSIIKSDLPKYVILKNSFTEIKRSVDAYIGQDVDVPIPKDPAGGYTHERHKENYMLMFNAGLLYNITGESRYAILVKDILKKYARLNPTLTVHPEATSSSPGHIFWQALNDANWLVYSGLAYDLIYNSVSAEERGIIENGAFKPEVDFFTKNLQTWFDLIHNHGVWACAGVGIVGIATNNENYLKMALYGSKLDGKSGFLAQLDNLFSPDGYYTEGPYYVRYAILPFYLFANALENARPELKIFKYRDRILQKALEAALQQTNINGNFFPVNDAIKEKDFTTSEMVTAIDITSSVYGINPGLLAVAQKQNRVILHKGGALIAARLQSQRVPLQYAYKSVEYADGAKGDEGGISFLRSGKGKELTTLIFKYASHGLSHGHYDHLGIGLFNRGHEILQDYGSVRYVGVEQKFGGRYLPENKTYAVQTIAHNTIVVDERTQFNGSEEEAEKYHSRKLYSEASRPSVQVVSATEENAYPGVKLHRTLFMVQPTAVDEPLVIDVFRTISASEHEYDLPFQYSGTVINTSFKYKPSTAVLQAMGKNNGYQHLWKEAEAVIKDTVAQFTFLEGGTYYTISSGIEDSAALYFTRTGAGDPNFNLRREPSYIIRKKGQNQTFVNVIEVHGQYDPIAEFSTASYPSVQNIRTIVNNEDYTLVEVTIKGKKLLAAQCNKDFLPPSKHTISFEGTSVSWSGPYVVLFDGKQL